MRARVCMAGGYRACVCVRVCFFTSARVHRASRSFVRVYLIQVHKWRRLAITTITTVMVRVRFHEAIADICLYLYRINWSCHEQCRLGGETVALTFWGRMHEATIVTLVAQYGLSFNVGLSARSRYCTVSVTIGASCIRPPGGRCTNGRIGPT